jgi:hypothetical protein
MLSPDKVKLLRERGKKLLQGDNIGARSRALASDGARSASELRASTPACRACKRAP